ncbi:TspO/MBR family protein [Patescibacteria group bacterium]
MKNIFKFIFSVLVCELAGAVGSFYTISSIPTWYASLEKPFFNPPNWIFAPVWIVLYFLMGIALYLAWKNNFSPKTFSSESEKKTWNPLSTKLWLGSWKEENAVSIFTLQLILNIIWTVIFFGLKSPGLAFFIILMLWFAILYTIVNFYRISRSAAILFLPYLLWVTFASILNLAIWQLNM